MTDTNSGLGVAASTGPSNHGRADEQHVLERAVSAVIKPESEGVDKPRPSALRQVLAGLTPGHEAEQTPGLIAALLEEAQEANASDIHLEPVNNGCEVRLRIDGVLAQVAMLERDIGLHVLRACKTQAELDAGSGLRPQSGRADFVVAGQSLSVRVSTAPGVRGEKIAMRLPTSEARSLTLNQLGLSPHDQGLVMNHLKDVRGLVLVAGPTGAGKTTTLYALVKELRQESRSIVSVEDPVEHLLDGVTQIQINERQGVTFAEGVKGLLRLDPDIVLMGEMRDTASGRAALEAAESGRACLTTLHARDAAATISVLRNFGYTDHDIAATVDLIVAQRLVRRLCEHCRLEEPLTEAERQLLTASGRPMPALAWHAVGCTACGGSGYRGRMGIFEIHRLREEDADLLMTHADERTLRQHIRQRGAASLMDSLLLKAAEGSTSLAEIQSVRGFGFYAVK